MRIETRLKLFVGLLIILGGYFFFTSPKVYEGHSKGFLGDVKVAVSIKDNKIKDIQVIEHSDTPKIAETAFVNLIKTIKETQSVEVNEVAGATYSSNALKGGEYAL